MKYIYFTIFIVLTIISCNYSLLVKKDRIVNNSFGFVFFGIQEESNMIIDFFVPVEQLDTSKDYLSDFLSQKKKTGFPINIERELRLKLMPVSDKFYNELYEKNHIRPINDFYRKTIGTLYILPVKVNYIDIYPIDDAYKIDTTFIFSGRKVSFSISPYRRVRQLDVYPLKWDR